MHKEALACAVAQARKCTETYRLGAVVMHGSSIVACGRNRNMNACGLSSIHAEMDAVWRVKGRAMKNCHVLVVRLRQDIEFGLSRPCAACARKLLRLGIWRVTYSTGDPGQPLVTEDLRAAAFLRQE